jgi:hypothetical protein
MDLQGLLLASLGDVLNLEGWREGEVSRSFN